MPCDTVVVLCSTVWYGGGVVAVLTLGLSLGCWLQVHFVGFDPKYDEWFEANAKKLAPVGTRAYDTVLPPARSTSNSGRGQPPPGATGLYVC